MYRKDIDRVLVQLKSWFSLKTSVWSNFGFKKYPLDPFASKRLRFILFIRSSVCWFKATIWTPPFQNWSSSGLLESILVGEGETETKLFWEKDNSSKYCSRTTWTAWFSGKLWIDGLEYLESKLPFLELSFLRVCLESAVDLRTTHFDILDDKAIVGAFPWRRCCFLANKQVFSLKNYAKTLNLLASFVVYFNPLPKSLKSNQMLC